MTPGVKDIARVPLYTDNKAGRGINNPELVTMKVILLGKTNIGKTSLTRRYIYDQFTSTESATIGAAFGAKRVEVDGKSLVMGIWDTAGSERYEAMSRIYYRGARAAIVCYDISDKLSFQRVRFWVDELRKNETECKIYLCGTKKDLIDTDPKAREVDIHDATDFADEYNAHIFETSSKSGENICELFNKIAIEYVKSNTRSPAPGSNTTVDLQDPGGGGRGLGAKCKQC